jgi:hypothetical protein
MGYRGYLGLKAGRPALLLPKFKVDTNARRDLDIHRKPCNPNRPRLILCFHRLQESNDLWHVFFNLAPCVVNRDVDYIALNPPSLVVWSNSEGPVAVTTPINNFGLLPAANVTVLLASADGFAFAS